MNSWINGIGQGYYGRSGYGNNPGGYANGRSQRDSNG